MFTQQVRELKQRADEFSAGSFEGTLPGAGKSLLPPDGLGALDEQQVGQLGDAINLYHKTDRPHDVELLRVAALEAVKFNDNLEKLRRDRKAEVALHPAEALAPLAIEVLASCETREAATALAGVFMASQRDGQAFDQILHYLLDKTGPGILEALERAIMAQRIGIEEAIPALARNWDRSAEDWVFSRIRRNEELIKNLAEQPALKGKTLQLEAELPRRAMCHWLLKTQDEAVAEVLIAFLGSARNKNETDILLPALGSREVRGWLGKHQVPAMDLTDERRRQVLKLLGQVTNA